MTDHFLKKQNYGLFTDSVIKTMAKKPSLFTRFCLMFVKLQEQYYCERDMTYIHKYKMFRGVQYVFEIVSYQKGDSKIWKW